MPKMDYLNAQCQLITTHEEAEQGGNFLETEIDLRPRKKEIVCR